jgi:hypothetical protein
MVNADQAHMPWVIGKIDEAIYRVDPAPIAASYEAITDLNKVLGSEHSSIINDFIANAARRLIVVQLLRPMEWLPVLAIYQLACLGKHRSHALL